MNRRELSITSFLAVGATMVGMAKLNAASACETDDVLAAVELYRKSMVAGDLAPNFYPALSSLWRLIMPCWAGCAMALGA